MPIQVSDDRIIDALLRHAARAVLAHSAIHEHALVSDRRLAELVHPGIQTDLGLPGVTDAALFMLNAPQVNGRAGLVLWFPDINDPGGRRHPRALIDLRRGSAWVASARHMQTVLSTQHPDTAGFNVNVVTGPKRLVDAWMRDLDMQIVDAEGAVTSCFTVPPTRNPHVMNDDHFLVAVLPVNRL